VAPLGQQVERLAIIQVIIKLAVGADAGERPPSHKAMLPKPAQTSMRYVLIAPCEAHDLRSRAESVP